MPGEVKKSKPVQKTALVIVINAESQRIAYDGEIDAIIADITAGEDVTRDFTYLYRGTSHGEKDYGNSYVEVNLTEQHVYVYKDGELVVESDCVSSCMVSSSLTSSCSTFSVFLSAIFSSKKLFECHDFIRE